MTNAHLHPYLDPETLAFGAAEFIGTKAKAAISNQGTFSMVLSGGSTPALTYQKLVEVSRREELDWSRVQVFWGDERCVPPEHEQSNYRLARQTLLDHVPIPAGNIHRMACEADPEAGSRDYEQVLRLIFPEQDWPAFDLILLGLGDDGHTASLFPGMEILNERTRWVAPVYVPHLNSWRISLTPPALNAANAIAFLVTGESKASTLKQILQPAGDRRPLPAMHIQPEGELLWFFDERAGSQLSFS